MASAERERIKRNFFRRLEKWEKRGFVYNKAALARLPSDKLEYYRGPRLQNLASGYQLTGVTGQKGEVVPIEVYREYRDAVWWENYWRNKNNPPIAPPKEYPIDYNPPKAEKKLVATTRAGLEALTRQSKRRRKQYWRERDLQMVQNYLKTLDVGDPTQDLYLEQIRDKIIAMGTEWAVNKLRKAQAGYLDIAPNTLFDSMQGLGTSNIESLLELFEIDTSDFNEVEDYNA